MHANLRRTLALVLAASLGSSLLPVAAFAQATPVDASRAEARDRFERGLKLFDSGDNAGALAEFKRAYELTGNTRVLYNLGLVYAAMGRPVEATDALDKLLANPTGLPDEMKTRATQTRAEVATRIAQLVVVTNVPAVIEVDNVEAGKAPLDKPIRVASGTHIVGAIAPGYAPLRREVTIASGSKADVKLDLVQMEGKVAHVTVKTKLPGADVVVDGEVVGRTPLTQSLTVPPGKRVVEVKRAGYVTARQELTLGDGASGELTFDPEEDAQALGAEGGALSLSISETDAVLSVDGKSKGPYTTPVKLARGPHRIRVERGGFEPLEREVAISAGRTTEVALQLDPTPETRANYVEHAKSVRTWGWVLTAGGALVGGGGVGYLVMNSKTKKDAQDTYDATVAQANFDSVPKSGRRCDDKSFVTGTQTLGDPALCQAEIDAAYVKLDDAKKKDLVGYVGAGVGGALLVTGVVMLISGDSPSKYDRPASDSIGRVNALPYAWSNGGTSGFGVVGTF